MVFTLFSPSPTSTPAPTPDALVHVQSLCARLTLTCPRDALSRCRLDALTLALVEHSSTQQTALRTRTP